MPEPRDPLLKVVIIMLLLTLTAIAKGLWLVLVVGEPTKETESTQKTRVNNSARPAYQRTPQGNALLGVSSLPSYCVMIPPQVHLRRPCYDFYFL
jgi:hypothetical protein